ncbi:MAG: Dephospho-CoA kinase [Pelotomaculum sp. PtaB.Bin104]|nr:MAG: Dephospho-CoA kinase [Pelotomaculum sp. PtaB.Bin104]
MPVIGLTGNIGSGKSTVSGYLAELGAQVVDADQVARDIVVPGAPALADIIENFGPEVLNQDGTLDRKKLGAIVYSDPQALAKLNQITHLRIVEAIREVEKNFRSWTESLRSILVIDAPLLIEVGLNQGNDEVWVVRVDPEVQVSRLMDRDGLSREEALRRIAAQMPQEEKLKHARRVIDNSGTAEETKQQIDRHLADFKRIFYQQA